MYQVTKRDGATAEFDIIKIKNAITKAFEAQNRQYHPSVIDLLALKVTADFEPKIHDGKIAGRGNPGQRGGGSGAESGYADVAKAYILYRKQREKIRNMKSTILDYKELVDSYVKVTRLAGEGEFHCDLFGRRADLEQQRRHYGQLLAVGDLR